MSKSFVMDDEHWITINGNHVLINGEGEVQSGMGGALKGVKLSKPKSNMKGKLSSAKKEYEQHDKKFGARYKSEFDRHNRALERIDKEQKRLDKEHENDWQEKDRDTYMKKRAELRNAEAELDGKKRDEDDKNESKLKQIGERSGYEKKAIYLKKEGVKKALSSARSKLKSAREANAYMKERGTKVSKATPDMVGGKFKTKEGELNATYERRSAQLDKLYRDKEKIKKENSDKKEKYSKAIQRLRNRRTEVDPSEKDKYKKLTSGMRERANELDNVTEAKLKNVSNRIKKLRDANAEERGAIIKKYGQAKQTLEKARPKIAERREAIRKYNQAASGTITSSPKATRADLKRMEQDVMNKKSAYQTARKKMASPDELRKLRDELDQARFDYRKARFPKQYGN